jgi:hypothetical protein
VFHVASLSSGHFFRQVHPVVHVEVPRPELLPPSSNIPASFVHAYATVPRAHCLHGPVVFFVPGVLYSFFCKRAKKMKFKKFSRTFSKELLRGHIFASGGENCANFSFASPFPTYAQTFTK